MSLTYTIDKAIRMVTIQYNANPDFAEFERTMETVFKDPNYKAGLNFLLDRHLVDEPPSTEYIKELVGFLKKHELKLNCVAFMVKNVASYGMGRMAQILAEDVDVRLQVFTDMKEAKQWSRSYST